MKKYFLFFLGIVLLAGLSAFTMLDSKDKKAQVTYYWFETDAGTGDQMDFLDNEVVYQNGPSTNPPSLCLETGDYKCIVGFSSTQVTFSGGTYHISNSVRQAPATGSGRFRATE